MRSQAQAPQEELREFSLRDIAFVLFRHKGKALLFFLAVIAFAVFNNMTSNEVYESEAKLIVRLGRETVSLDPTATTGQTLHVSRSLSSEINSELEILRSRDLVEEIVETIGPREILGLPPEQESRAQISFDPLLKRLGLRQDVPLQTVAVDVVTNTLEIGVQRASNIIRLGYTGHSPAIAQRVLGLLIEHYLAKHIEIHQTPGSYDFFAQQTDQLRKQLGRAEQELREVRQATGIVSFEEQNTMVLRRIDDLQTSIANSEAQLEYSRAKLVTLRELIEGLDDMVVTQSVVVPDETADGLRTRLFDLRLRAKELGAQFFDDSPFLEQVLGQIAEAEAILAAEDLERTEQTMGPNAAKRDLELQTLTERLNLSSFEARLIEQRRQLEDALNERTKLNTEEHRITRLEREIERDEKNFERYIENLEQSRIYNALEKSKISNIGVLQAATFSGQPVGPKRMRNLAMALFFGFFGACALAFVADFMDQTIKSPDDTLQRLDLSTLVSVPRVRQATVQAPGRWDEDDYAPTGWSLPSALLGPFKNLHTWLLHPVLERDPPACVVGIASCYAGAGVSTVTANLGTSLASAEEGRILIIDANLGAPEIHSLFGAELSPGLADLLATHQRDPQTIQPTPVPELDLLAAGVPSTHAGYDDMAHFKDLFATVRERYRMVLIDLPPLIDNVFATRLARLCDTTVLVVETEKQRRQVVERATNELERVGVELAGVVLNKRRYPIPDWLYRML